MDTTSTYCDIVKQMLLQYAQLRPSHGEIRLEVVFDDIRGRYALMQVGWERGRRVRGNLLYITVHDETVFIEYDGLEHGITNELIAKGIPGNRIVLAFLPETQAGLHAQTATYPAQEECTSVTVAREI